FPYTTLLRSVEGDAVRLLWTEQLRVRDHVGLERHWDVVGRGRVRGLANELLHIGILLQEDPVVTHRELRHRPDVAQGDRERLARLRTDFSHRELHRVVSSDLDLATARRWR